MKVVIAGYGLEGEASYHYYRNQGADVTIADEHSQLETAPLDVPLILGPDAFSKLRDFDLVIRTPGLAPDKIVTNGLIWSATNEFFAQCPAPIIGITGTKGKGTTASFIASLLKTTGKKIHLLGNIGLPSLRVLPEITQDDIVVYELSSFQLWDVTKSPQTAVLLMIEPDHQDVHKDMDDYIAAKAHITAFQSETDRLVYTVTNDITRRVAETTRAQKIPVPSPEGVHTHDNAFYYGETRLCETKEVVIPGAHNLQNAMAAIAAAWPWVQESTAIAEGLHSFTGLSHRLKYVRTINEISYYDDSIATTPGSAIAAIHAFPQPKVLILGGSSKGADFHELVAEMTQAAIRYVVLIGDEASKIQQTLEGSGIPYEVLGSTVSMTDIVVTASSHAQDGDVVILSPACASFGMFKNYADRGDQFIHAVEGL